MPRTLPKPTLDDARRILVEAAPDLQAAGEALVISWVQLPRKIAREDAPGQTTWYAVVRVTAPGFPTRNMALNRDAAGTTLD